MWSNFGLKNAYLMSFMALLFFFLEMCLLFERKKIIFFCPEIVFSFFFASKDDSDPADIKPDI